MSDIFSKQMANREVCDLIFYDYSTKKPFLNLDFANTTSTEITGETMFAYGGKGHPKKVSFSGEKGGTLTIETQMQTVKLWELITGGTRSNTSNFIKKIDATVETENKITLNETSDIKAGSVQVYLTSDTNFETELKCTVADKVITLTDVQSEGTKVTVFYEVTKTGVERINIKATNFPKAFTVYGDTYMKTEDDDILPYKIVAYKCTPQSNMSLSFANTGDPGTITITCDLMVDKEGNMLDLILEKGEE